MNTRKTVEFSPRKKNRTRKDGSEGTDEASALTPSHSSEQRDPRESSLESLSLRFSTLQLFKTLLVSMILKH